MATSTDSAQLTAEQFLRTTDPIDAARTELFEGEIRVIPPGSGLHGAVHLNLAVALNEFAETVHAEALPGVGYILARNPDTVLAPDVSVVRLVDIPSRKIDDGFPDCRPQLAAEIIEMNDRDGDGRGRAAELLRFGVERVWLVFLSDRHVECHRISGAIKVVPSDGVLTSDDAGFAVEGFELRVSEIFG